MAARNKSMANKLSSDINSWEKAAQELHSKSPNSKSKSEYSGYLSDLQTTENLLKKQVTSSSSQKLPDNDEDDDEGYGNSLRVDDGASSKRDVSVVSTINDEMLNNEIPAPVPSGSSTVGDDDDDMNDSLEVNKMISQGSFGDSLQMYHKKIKSGTSSLSATPKSSSQSNENKIGYDVVGRQRRGYYMKLRDEPRHDIDLNPDILGQSHLRGVDGSVHAYFNLKVIFEPNTTGFEDKEFTPPKGSIIAGRYQVKEVLGQVNFTTSHIIYYS
jgi:hypothetical protein